MGVPVSKGEDPVMKQRSKEIDQQLRRDASKETSVIKLLLLGTAECGKTTLLKQMKILHGIGFNEQEMFMQRRTIYLNIVSAMYNILTAMRQYSISFDNREIEADADIIRETKKIADEGNDKFSFELIVSLKRLWADEGVQQCYLRGNEYNLPDSAKYFFDNIDRISQKTYVPTEQDILRTRAPTTGIVELEFMKRNILVRVYDVGGQRSERRKWIHCFDNVNAVFFIASLSEYNMVLMEDERTISFLLIQESLILFKTIANSPFFAKSGLILFLNKSDIFREKIKQFPLTIAFPEYKGSQSYEETSKYIQKVFEKVVQKDQKPYVHKTCATDTKEIDLLFNSCFNIVVEANLKSSGL